MTILYGLLVLPVTILATTITSLTLLYSYSLDIQEAKILTLSVSVFIRISKKLTSVDNGLDYY